MNKLFSKIAALSVGLAMAVGVGVAVGSKSAKVVKAATASMTTFSAVSGLVGGDPNISYEARKGSAATAPVVNGGEVRVYQNGGEFEVTSESGISMTSVTISSSMATSVLVSVDGSAESSNRPISANGSTTVSGISASSVLFTCKGTDKNSRLYVKSLSVTYDSAASLTSIALSGSMTKTSYTTADEWDPSGLTVTGTYSDSSSKPLTTGVTFTYFNASNVEVATPKDLGISSGQTLKVVASYPGVSDTDKYTASSSIEVTKAVEYELVTDVSKLTNGTTFMLVATGTYTTNTYTRAMKQVRTTSNSASAVSTVELSNGFNAGSLATSSGATIFTLSGAAGAWKIKNGDNQLGFTGTSNNNMQFNENQTDTFKITTQSGYLLSIESNTRTGRKLQYNVNSGDPRFSNYNGGQTYVYMFANIAEASYGTTDHIDITALPETEFAVGDTFNTNGISVTAWDGADESSANPKSVDVFSTLISGNPSTPFSDDDIGPHTVTVTYNEDDHDFTDTYSIYVYAAATYELVEEAPQEWDGTYLITYTVETETTAIPETGTYAMRSSLTNFDVVGNFSKVSPVTEGGKTTITAGQHLQWSFATISGGYSIQGQSGKYIGWNSASSNGLTTSNTALVNTLSFNNGNVSIVCSAGTKGLTLSSSSGQFRYYSNATVQLYKLVTSDKADEFAQTFLSAFTCDATGENEPTFTIKEGSTKWSWALLEAEYNTLSGVEKEQFHLGTASTEGDNIAQALARYDFVVGKYGTAKYKDFMSRDPAPIGVGRLDSELSIADHNTTMIIVIAIAATSAIALSLLLVLKKRKHN